MADASSLVALESEVRSQVLESGSVLFREGDPSDAMYLVLRGELEVTVENPEHGSMVVGRIGPGEPVGEMQILSGGRRMATVVATAESELARIERAAIERLASHDPGAMRHLADGIRRRVRRNQLAAILPSLLGSVDEAMLGDVEAAVTWMSLSRSARTRALRGSPVKTAISPTTSPRAISPTTRALPVPSRTDACNRPFTRM